jgi:uncharacterized protein (TIGR03437 family)
MNLVRSILFLFVSLPAAFAQTVEWDNAGNGQLQGTFHFREAMWITDANASNTLDEATSQFGSITFDGNGNYTASVSYWTSVNNGSSGTTTWTGVYAISLGGFGFIRRSRPEGGDIYGSISRGVFIGSSTESGFNNLFVASLRAPTAEPRGAYRAAYTNLATANLSQVRDASFRFTIVNNSSSIGPVTVTGYSGGNYNAATQTISTASYTFTNSAGTLNLGPRNNTDLLSGTLQFFISPDGQFIFGGSTTGWDMFVGIKELPTNVPPSTFDGLFFQAGIDVKRSTLPSGTGVLNSYFGALNPINSITQLIGHQRVQSAPEDAYDYTYSDFFSIASDNSHDDFLGFQNFISADGNYRIGHGRQDYLGLNVAVKAPTFVNPTTPFINPMGVVNAASFTPFTTGLAPGELITIFGANFSSTTTVDTTFPTSIGTGSDAVTVTINGRLSPIYVVSPTQISAIVPYQVVGSVAEIQVSRGTVKSNRVTSFINRTAPGVFAVPPTGLGYAAALHPDYSLVTPQNPAQVGETIAVYLTGLGLVSPSIPNGAAGPVNPLSKATEDLRVSIGNRNATIEYAGLAPLLRGLYQLNVTIPPGTGAGDQYLDIIGPDTFSSQILVPVGGDSRAATQAAPAPRGRR